MRRQLFYFVSWPTISGYISYPTISGYVSKTYPTISGYFHFQFDSDIVHFQIFPDPFLSKHFRIRIIPNTFRILLLSIKFPEISRNEFLFTGFPDIIVYWYFRILSWPTISGLVAYPTTSGYFHFQLFPDIVHFQLFLDPFFFNFIFQLFPDSVSSYVRILTFPTISGYFHFTLLPHISNSFRMHAFISGSIHFQLFPDPFISNYFRIFSFSWYFSFPTNVPQPGVEPGTSGLEDQRSSEPLEPRMHLHFYNGTWAQLRRKQAGMHPGLGEVTIDRLCSGMR